MKIILSKYFRQIFILFFYSSCAFLFSYHYFLHTWEYPPGSLEKIAAYQADKVFQTRILIPFLSQSLADLFPISIDRLSTFRLPVGTSLYFYCFGFVWLATLLLLLGFQQLLTKLSHSSLHLHLLTFLILFIPLFWNYAFLNNLFYPYDIPSMAFFIWGIYLFSEQRYRSFYILYIFANLNRESSCFITLAILFMEIKFPPMIANYSAIKFLVTQNKLLFSQVFLQGTIWITIKSILHFLFIQNPGSFFEKPQSFLSFLDKAIKNEVHWAFTGTPGDSASWFFTIFLGLWILIPLRWKKLSLKGKRLLSTCIPFILIAVFRANLMEIRIYNELLIILSMCAAMTFNDGKHPT